MRQIKVRSYLRGGPGRFIFLRYGHSFIHLKVKGTFTQTFNNNLFPRMITTFLGVRDGTYVEVA